MDVRLVLTNGIEEHDEGALEKLLVYDEGFVWIDLPQPDDHAFSVMRESLGFHAMALDACRERNHVPTVHGYRDHLFLVLHRPHRGVAGHVHLLELDMFLGERFLVTVHGPLNPAVPKAEALAETRAVMARMEAGRFRPSTPVDLAYAITTGLIRQQRALIGQIAESIPGLEEQVMTSSLRNPESLLEEMFLLRQELLTVRTMASQGHEVLARGAALASFLSPEGQSRVYDLAEQCDRVSRIAEGEKEFLLGVIDLFQTRTTTKMTVAMERLAVLAAVTLPITAIASVYGMNVIVNSHTHVPQLIFVLLIMAVISGVLLRWTHKQGWW